MGQQPSSQLARPAARGAALTVDVGVCVVRLHHRQHLILRGILGQVGAEGVDASLASLKIIRPQVRFQARWTYTPPFQIKMAIVILP